MSAPAERGELPQLLSVATLTRAHGIRGELRVRCSLPMLEFLEDVAEAGIALTLRSADGSSERSVFVAGVRGHESAPIIAIDGVEDRSSAELMRGSVLCAPRELLPPPDEDEFYLADLVGCAVHAMRDGGRIGVVDRAESLPANVVLTITLDAGGTVLAPLVEVAVPQVDIEGRRIDIDAEYLGLGVEPEDDGS